MDENQKSRVTKTAHFIAYSSLILAILSAIHNFIVLDDSVVRQLLTNSGQKATDNAIGTIRNSFQYTGVMWFMFAAFTTNVLYNLINVSVVLQAISDAKSVLSTLPLIIVLVASTLIAIYMLVVSIKRKSTFNR